MLEPVAATVIAESQPLTSVRRHIWRKAAAWEHLLMFVVMAGVVWTAWRFWRDGYLPQPFYYLPNASLMDLYTTAMWAHSDGAYTMWHSIYPPLSFDILRLFTAPRCYAEGDVAGRACDHGALSVLLAMFFLNGGLAFLSYHAGGARPAAPRAVAAAAGLPMLYALERGNLLIPCFTAFVLGVGPLVRSRWGRIVALAFAVNFKPYLLGVILPAAARRDGQWLMRFGLAGLLVYLVTFLAEGAGTPQELLADIGGYRTGNGDALWANLYYATSYWPLARFISAREAFAAQWDPWLAPAFSLLVVVAMRCVQVAVALCMVAAAIRPNGFDARRFMAMFTAMILSTITNGSSGYALIFLVFLVFFEPWRGVTRACMLVAAYLLCVPFDWVLWPLLRGEAHSFLSGRNIVVSYGVSIGHLLRPGLVLVIQVCLIILNFRDVLGKETGPNRGAIATGSVAGAPATL